MSDPSFQIVCQGSKARAICGLPLIRAVTVFLHPSGKSLDNVNKLTTAICDFLLDLSPQAKDCASACAHDMADVATCNVCADPNRLKLLVLVGDKEPLSVDNEAWWIDGSDERRILPVYQADVHPEKWLNSPKLKLLNAFFYQTEIVEAVATVLSAADVTNDVHRLFISYRRLETQPLAEQLFSELSKVGFEVFLDRFSVPAAAQFQRRLHHELAEKSMVLLLESDRFAESIWSAEEIAYCKQYRLGLFAVRMPHGAVPDQANPNHKKPTTKLPDIDDDLRETLDIEDFEPGEYPKTINGSAPGDPPFLQWGPLSQTALKRIVDEIKLRHDQAQLRRLETIRKDMIGALKLAKASSYGIRADGMLSVDCGAKKYAIWITTRPPELPDFHVTYAGSQTPAGTTGVIVGHRQLLEPDVHRRLSWLSGVCRLIWVDEGNLLSAAYDIAGGTL
jgi:hypothetical protein